MIDSFIPEAKRRARQRVKELGAKAQVRRGVNGSEYIHDYFTEFFHEEMNKMLKEAGLRR